MAVNDATLSLIIEFEGVELKAYPDPAHGWAVPTIGVGHTSAAGPPVVVKGMTLTKAEALDILRRDLANVEATVARLVKVPLDGNQRGAIVSFTFNLGEGNLKKSTLLKKLNAGDYAGATGEFKRWNKAGGKVLAGLTRRRAAEANLFATPATPEPAVEEFEEAFTAPTPKEPVMSNRPILDAIKAGTKAVLNREHVDVAAADVQSVTNEVMREVAPRVQNATNAEPWWRSRIILGLITAIVGMIVRKAGGELASGDVEFVLNTGSEIVAALGALYALYGRTFAASKKPLGV